MRLRACGLLLLLAAGACTDLVTAPEDTRFVVVAAGGAHSCAVDADGRAWCWGSNSSGQLGVGASHESVASPAAVAGGPYRTIAAGGRHTCALDREGRLWCWGSNDSGQLGDGGFGDQDEPRRVRIDRPLARIALGASHSCAADLEGAVWCWGRNDRGQAGPGPAVVPLPRRHEQVAAAGGISAGGAHSCAIVTTGAVCWGGNDQHQLGSATSADSPHPQRVAAPGLLHVVALGRAHSCGLTSDRSLVCWGSNELGQVGAAEPATVGTAIAIPSLGGSYAFLGAGSGGNRSCVGSADAVVWCWGAHPDPRLGTIVTRPVTLRGLPNGSLTGLTVGDAHACALVAQRIFCWGDGASGQLGDGRQTYAEEAVPVSGSEAR